MLDRMRRAWDVFRGYAAAQDTRASTWAVSGGGAESGRRPETQALTSNRFAGKVKLSAEEWAAVRGKLAPFVALLG
jgi:hypothetical protein